jgi:hypothetical protein
MAKQQTFADKLMKGKRKTVGTCPKCGTEYSYVLHVSTEKSEKSGAWKFNQRHTRVCKCNEKQIYN